MFGRKNKDVVIEDGGIPQIKSVACFECHMLVAERCAQRFDVDDRDEMDFAGGHIQFGKKGIGFFCPQHTIPNLSKVCIRNGEATYMKFVPESFVAIDKKGAEIKAKPVKK